MENRKEESSKKIFEAHKDFFDAHREAFRQGLKNCLLAARAYNGTEETDKALFSTLEAFETWQYQTFATIFSAEEQPRLSEETERLLLERYHPGITATMRSIGHLLDLATERCSKRLMRDDNLLLKVCAQRMDGTFLPLGSQNLSPSKDNPEPFVKEQVFTPRLRMILGALQERKIFLDDVVLWVGDPPVGAFQRMLPYILIEIPRLKGRQILICNQKNEAAYVITDPLDPKLLLSTSKDILTTTYPETVKRVEWVTEEAWKAKLMHLTFLDVAPGQKVDIALREDIRRQILEKYRLEDFIDEKGKDKFNFTGRAEAGTFIIAGRRFTALASLFGLNYEDASSRSPLAGLRFLAAVYGASHPALEPHLWKEERQRELQKKLGTDKDFWRAYLQGSPIEIRARGRTFFEEVSTPIRDAEALLAFSKDQATPPSFGGKSLKMIATFFLSVEEISEVAGLGAQNNLFLAYLARAIFGESSELQKRIEKLRMEAAVQKELGISVEKWRSYFKGEPLSVVIDEKKRTAISEPSFPTRESLEAVPLKELRTLKIGGVALSWLAQNVFSSIEPEFKITSAIGDSSHLLRLFIKSIYGSNETLDAQIEQEKCERAAKKLVEKNPSLLKDVIKGIPLAIRIGTEERFYVAERVFPTVEDFITCPAKGVRQKLTFVGLGLNSHEFLKLILGEAVRPDFNPGSVQDDLEYLALKIYGNVQLASGEWLADRVQKQEEFRELRNMLGSDAEEWRLFLKGDPYEVVVGQKKSKITVEQPIRSREEFLSMSGAERRSFSVAGMGLSKFARILGLPSSREYNVFSMDGLTRIADVLFGSLEKRSSSEK